MHKRSLRKSASSSFVYHPDAGRSRTPVLMGANDVHFTGKLFEDSIMDQPSSFMVAPSIIDAANLPPRVHSFLRSYVSLAQGTRFRGHPTDTLGLPPPAPSTLPNWTRLRTSESLDQPHDSPLQSFDIFLASLLPLGLFCSLRYCRDQHISPEWLRSHNNPSVVNKILSLQ